MNFEIPSNISGVINILREKGYEGYLVGGCVRDAAMGKIPHDFDITTNALPHEIIKCFEGYRIIETGLKHGTVTVVSDGENIEITTYRIDGIYLDNRRPVEVSFTPLIEEDLARRDFTVNAMAYNPYDGYIDIFGGMKDLESKIIRCVGNADKRFNEDGLRIMRAMRFASVLDFKITSDTSDSIHRNKNLMNNISAERIFSELKKLICGTAVSDILKDYYDVMCTIFPMFSSGKERYMSNIKHLRNLEDDYILRFACLLNGFEHDEVRDFIRRLKTDNNTLKNVTAIADYVSAVFNTDKVSLRYLMNSVSDENIRRIAVLKRCFEPEFDYENFMKAYNNEFQSNPCVTIKQLEINGHDLIALGIKPGAELGRCMNDILKAVIEEKCENKHDSLIAYAKETAV